MATVFSIDYLKDYHKYKPSLFRESPNLDSLIEAILSVCSNQQDLLLWLSKNILNLDIAEGWHLDFIGSLVGQERILVNFNQEYHFGFEGAYKSDGFSSMYVPDIGGYWKSRSAYNSSTVRVLTDAEYRRLIKARVISNHSGCTTQDLIEVVNLITDRKDSTIQTLSHGLLKIKAYDATGILSYYVDKIPLVSGLLPIPVGVRVVLENLNPDDYNNSDTGKFTNLLAELVNIRIPYAFHYVDPDVFFGVGVLVNQKLPNNINR